MKKKRKKYENETQSVSRSLFLLCVSRCSLPGGVVKRFNEKETPAVEQKSLSLVCSSSIKKLHLQVNRIDILSKHHCITRVFCNKLCYKLAFHGEIA